MRKHYGSLLFALALAALAPMLFFVTQGFAADEAPKVDLGFLQSLVVAVIPVVTGVVMAVVKNAVAMIPNQYIPILSPIVGVLLQAVAQAFGTTLVPGLDGPGALTAAAALGSTATGVHQIRAQLAG